MLPQSLWLSQRNVLLTFVIMLTKALLLDDQHYNNMAILLWLQFDSYKDYALLFLFLVLLLL